MRQLPAGRDGAGEVEAEGPVVELRLVVDAYRHLLAVATAAARLAPVDEFLSERR